MTTRTAQAAASPHFLNGGGELGALMRSKDWATTAVGRPESWPQGLKTAVQIMLGSRYAMWIGWGPELIFFYNDAYRPTLGVKHPWALSSSARDVWREIWPAIGPRIDNVVRHGDATWDQALLLFLERHGYPEETYHTFSYSPLYLDDGNIGGVLCVVIEDTERVIGERRLRALRELAAALATTQTRADVFAVLQSCFAAHDHDLPFTLTYLLDDNGGAERVAASGIAALHEAAPPHIDLGRAASWPLSAALAQTGGRVIDDLGARFDALPSGPWHTPPSQAIILPLAQQGQEQPAGIFIAALNPHRPFDVEYRGFVEVIAGQIAAALASAVAYEEERQRAEALAEINRAKTVFFSNVSHEFRTPLTLMLSPLEDMLERMPGDDAATMERHELALVHRNGLRLLKLVNTLLDFSRIEANRIDAVFEPIDLAAFTVDLASTFRSAMTKAALHYVVDCAPLDQPVYVDRDMWEKIVLNLISNAFKYTLKGEVAVTLRALDDHQVQLAVSDSGVGIPAAHLPHLFERFYRVEGQRGRSLEGTGIGLALVQELVQLHGGRVTVTSTVGRGTRFEVTLPFGHAHLPAEHINTTARAAHAPRSGVYVEEALRWLGDEHDSELAELPSLAHDGDRPRIVLADDNDDMRAYMRRLLAARYDVEVVADGRAAFRAVLMRRPDLVVSDVMMPHLDGFGLVQALRADNKLADIPVILVSARAGEEAHIEGLRAGADDYLAKPFSARELLARVASNLDSSRLRRQAAEALREEAERLDTLNRTGAALAAELDLERLVQTITDAAVKLTDAKFGAFFYNAQNEAGESYTLYTLAGAARDAFADFPMPRITAVFAPTFAGEHIVRSDDIRRDPRYGQSGPFYGIPEGHLPVVSYLAAPVVLRSGEVIGGLLLGHPEPGVFTERAERLVQGVTAQAAIAIDNARLYTASRKAEQDLRQLLAVYQQHQARLADSEARLRIAADAAALGIFEWRVAENVSYWENARMYEIFGRVGTDGMISEDEFFNSILHPDDAAHYARVMMEAQERNGTLDLRYRIRRANDGAERWLQVSGTFELMPNGGGQRLVGTVADITEHKIAEDALKLADRRKDEFLAMLAHELRNPLAPILTTLQVLEYSTTPETMQWARDIIGRQTEQLTRLVDDLLDVSRVTQGKITLRNEEVTLADIVERAVETSRPIIGVRAHRLEIDLPAYTVYLRGDAVRLIQVLANLLNNAAKYTPNGGLLRVHGSYADGHVAIAVEDNGLGISPELLPHVFDLFAQGDAGMDQSQGGLGIGLTLVRSLVAMHGGTVEAASEGRGKGSVFTVRLPGVLIHETKLPAEAAAGPIERVRHRVLVIDDNKDATEALALLLRIWGHEVEVAFDGAAGITSARERRPDVVLCDLGLPGLSGYDVVQALRTLPDGQAMTIAAVTGYGQDIDKLRTSRAGFDAHLVKPVDPSVLEAFLNAPRVND